MTKLLKNLIKSCINSLGFEILNLKALNESRELHAFNELKIAELKIEIDRNNYIFSRGLWANKQQLEILGLLNPINAGSKSNAQLAQDLFVLEYLNGLKNGFFVEFGATDGYSLSNTFLLEKEYGWRGILAEPARVWQKSLRKHRNCIIDNRCIWSKSGEMLTFYETNEAELSTLDVFSAQDLHFEKRKDKKSYFVETISLTDLLDEYKAPANIDYLSIDTEGSEFEILQAFDFSKYQFKIITVEHNFTFRRHGLFKLLIANGYKRIFETISLFDDWYIKEEVYSDYLNSRNGYR
jgi:FkbM family methyltransferase